jgi:GntR family transcriptional regulator
LTSVSTRAARRVDRASAVPYYYQLKQILSERITSAEWTPGAQLPGEYELCTLYDVSRTVVRQALNELFYEGLIERHKGRGTFVARPKLPEGLISGLTGMHEDAARRGQTLRSTVLTLRNVPATSSVAQRLQMNPGDPVVELERLRFIEEQPWVVVTTYLPATLVPGLVERDFAGNVSLYRVLEEEYGLPLVAALRTVEATIAGPRDALLLGIKEGDPLLVLRSASLTTEQRPLEYFIAHHRGDQSAFTVYLAPGSKQNGPVAAANVTLTAGTPDV